MSARFLAIIFGAAFGGFVIVGIPMSAVAPLLWNGLGLTFDHASGRAWNGTLHNASLGANQLGDLELQFNPFYLALLRTHYSFSFDGFDGTGDGVVETGLGSYFALKDTNMRVSVEHFSEQKILAGALYLDDVSLVLNKDGCRIARGQFSTDVLEQSASTLGWQGPVLDGMLECVDGALRVPMQGSSGSETVRIVTSVFADRRYETSVAITTENTLLQQILPAVGFSEEAGVLAFEQTGHLSAEEFIDPLGG